MNEQDKIIARLNELGIICWFEDGQLIYQQNHIGILNNNKSNCDNSN